VDTFLHASGMIGHSSMLGLVFPTTWEMESKDRGRAFERDVELIYYYNELN
jgi:hypothetical protein